HSFIDLVSYNSLTYRYGVFDPVALANVFRYEAFFPRMIANRHPAPAYATDHQALQQCRTFTRRTLAPVGSDRLRVFPKTAEVLLVLLPRDVTGMSILEQRPLLARQPGVRGAAIGMIASAAPAIDECACITRIVQDVQCAAVWEFRPHQIAFVRPFLQP